MLTSVLIPCYNAERYVGEAIESALAQDNAEIEVVVLDDGSTDGSLSVIQKHEGDPRFRCETGPNRGGNAARNRLLELSRGEYVQWLDADDVLHPTKVTRLIELLQDGCDAAFSFCSVQGAGGVSLLSYDMPTGDLLTYFVRNSVITMLPLHRRKDLIASGGFDESLKCCQEYELHQRLARCQWKRVGMVAEPLCTKREIEGSVSSSERRVFGQRLAIMQTLLATLEEAGEATPDRRTAIGQVAYSAGRQLVRARDETRAREAFAFAGRLLPTSARPLDQPMQVLTRVLGPVVAERVHGVLTRSGKKKRSEG